MTLDYKNAKAHCVMYRIKRPCKKCNYTSYALQICTDADGNKTYQAFCPLCNRATALHKTSKAAKKEFEAYAKRN